jgi:hypothetical protein
MSAHGISLAREASQRWLGDPLTTLLTGADLPDRPASWEQLDAADRRAAELLVELKQADWPEAAAVARCLARLPALTKVQERQGPTRAPAGGAG